MPRKAMGARIFSERIIAILRDHAGDLRRAGIRHSSLFGSVARDQASEDSDVDLLAEFDTEARIGLFELGALERRLGDLIGRKVDLLAEPIETERLRAAISREKRSAF